MQVLIRQDAITNKVRTAGTLNAEIAPSIGDVLYLNGRTYTVKSRIVSEDMSAVIVESSNSILYSNAIDAMRNRIVKCKNCIFWENNTDKYFADGKNYCTYEDSWNMRPHGYEVWAAAHDDSGMEVALITGPDFGCVNYKGV